MRKKTSLAAALVAAAALTLTACGSGGDSGKSARRRGLRRAGAARPRPSSTSRSTKPDLVLTDTHGKKYDLREETKGKPTLIYFGYTHCPDVCPLTMSNIAIAKKQLPKAEQDKLRVVFVTTDPERDTPAALGKWLKAQRPLLRRPDRRLRHHPGRRTPARHRHRAAEEGEGRQDRLHARRPGHRLLPEDRQGLRAVRRGHHGRRLHQGPPQDHQGGEPVNRRATALAAVLALTARRWRWRAASSDGRRGAELKVSGAYMPQPVDADMAAGFLTVHQQRRRGGQADLRHQRRLRRRHDPRDRRTRRCRRSTSFDVPADGELDLERGGNHIMFMKLKQQPKQGEKVTVELHFEKSDPIKVELPVEGRPRTTRRSTEH